MRRMLFFIILLFTVQLFAGNAKVKYMIGEVRYKQAASGSNWQPVTLQTVLHEKDVLRTGVESMCEIELADGSVTKLLQSSLLELRNLPEKPEDDTELFTGLGKFFFKVKKILSRKFLVSSPVSVAAVRGTEFMTINDGDQTKILVKEGMIDFSDIYHLFSVQIPAGHKSLLQAGSGPTAPKPLSNDEMAALQKASKIEQAKTPAPKKEIKREKPLPKPQPKAEPKPKPEQPARTVTPPPAPPQTPAPELPKGGETPPPPKKAGSGGGMHAGVSIGAVTLDGKLYNQIGLRPEFTFGKLGVALDLSIYIDEEGNIRKDNWDSFRDIFEKIYYVRWGQRKDPFYVRVGAIDNYRLGYGLLMNHYSNTVEYPNVIRTGMELGVHGKKMGFDGMINNFSELTNSGGLLAGRFSYNVLGKLQIGASVVYDVNQYKALNDRDGDGVPDYLDAFPDSKQYAIDSDHDGIPDSEDPDRDGNGFTDNPDWLIANGYDTTYINDDAYLKDPAAWVRDSLAPEPFNINKAQGKAQLAVALDASYPILNFKYLQLTTYAQWAKFPFNGGWGVTFPGFLAKFAFINAYAEYRVFGAHFLPEYFNTTYELERATFKEVTDSNGVTNIEPVSKRQLLDDYNEKLRGYVIGADFNLWDFLIFGAEYQNMSKSNFHVRTFRSTLDLNTSFIPKINRAGAYFYQNNAEELFKRTEGTILGYRLEYEISGGASLLLDFRQTYRDLNGDGKISGPDETVRTTNIQTVIRF